MKNIGFFRSCQFGPGLKFLYTLCLSMLISHVACAQAPANSLASEETDAWYPRTLTGDKGSITLYAPQISEWKDFKTLNAVMAFQIQLKGSSRSPYGSVNFSAQTDIDLENREVLYFELQPNSLSIPGLGEEEPEYQVVREAIKAKTGKVPLDLVLEYLPEDLPLPTAKGLLAKAPPIFFSTAPAVLLTIDARPVYLPAGESGLEFILNANWNVFREREKSAHYLLSPQGWLTASSLDGNWTWAKSLPKAFAKLPDDPSWQEVKAALPGDLGWVAPPSTSPAKVFTAMEPSELILFDGQPRWTAIADTGIDMAANSQADLFRFQGNYYFLTAGRWFVSPSLEKGWVLQSELPAAFRSIPTDHDKGYVRASIPGTREAWEAAIIASVPVSLKVDRKDAATLAPQVKHAGKPVFVPIEGTNIEMATSTSYQLLKYNDTYYLCYNATWFVGKTPEGPWAFADMIPAEFAKIPPSSPVYNTTYVTIDNKDDNSVVYNSSAGYTNSYVSESGTVVNGTGFVQSAAAIWLIYEIVDEADYVHFHYGYPYYHYPYYPWPPTYGYGAWYNPSTGRYGETLVGYGPYGAARSTAVYNPETGFYGRGQSVWDSDEYAGRSYTYNPNTNTSVSRRGYYDFDDNEGWSESVRRRGDEWVYRETEWDDDRVTSDFETSRGGEGTVTRERDGDEVSGSGSFETGRGREIETEYSREKNGDEWETERTISGENRSVNIDGRIEDGEGSFDVDGSRGGEGSFNRELDDGELSGSGSFSRNGKTIEGETTRSAEGVKREFESSEGGQAVAGRQGDNRGFVGETGSGDVYAGHNGEVYKKTDSGWEQVDAGNNVTSNASRSRSGEQAVASRELNSGQRQWENQGRANSQATTRINAENRTRLERDSMKRQRGYDRYQSFQRSRPAATSRPGSGMGRRR